MRLTTLAIAVLAWVELVAAASDRELSPGTGRIVIEPRHAGRRIERDRTLAAEVTLTGRTAGASLRLRARLFDGKIELGVLDTDIYENVHVAIDAEPSNPIGMSGDYVGSVAGPWTLHRDGETLQRSADVERVMRLVRPEDTRFGVPRESDDAPPAFHSPVAVTWDPVPGATSYRVRLSQGGFARIPAPEVANTSDTTWKRDLPPSGPEQSYWLTVEALGRDGRVGVLTVDGADIRRAPYRFRVVPADAAETALHPPAESVVRDTFKGRARLVLVPTLDGQAWALPPLAWARVRLVHDEDTEFVDVRPVDGIVEIGDLTPGTYSADVVVRDEPDTTRRQRAVCQRPQDEQPARVTLADDAVARREIALRCAIQMRQPRWPAIDPRRPSMEPPPEFSSPVTFEWAAVPGAVRYRYAVERFDGAETVASGEAASTQWTAKLEPSLPQEHYRLLVTAYGRTEEVGYLDRLLRFRVAGGQPEPGIGRIVLMPTFDGAPLTRALPVNVDLGRVDPPGHRTVGTRLATG